MPEITFYLRPGETVEVDRRDGSSCWIELTIGETEITVFATAMQLDALTDALVRLRRPDVKTMMKPVET